MPGVDERQEIGLGGLIGQLGADVREIAQAEIDLVRAKTSAKIGRVRNAAIFFGIAAVLALAALIALLIGLIFTLAPHVGPGIATLIVVGITLIVVGALALVGRSALTGSAA